MKRYPLRLGLTLSAALWAPLAASVAVGLAAVFPAMAEAPEPGSVPSAAFEAVEAAVTAPEAEAAAALSAQAQATPPLAGPVPETEVEAIAAAPAASPKPEAVPAAAALPAQAPAPARPATSPLARFFGGFQAEILAGPVLGLERALRGGRFALGAGYAPRGLGLGARAGLEYDAAFGAWIGQAELRLLFGSDLALGLGAELPFGDLLLLEPRSGVRLSIGPAAIPMRFSLEATAIELRPGTSRAKGGAGPRILLSGELSWSAYRVLDILAADGGTAPPLANLLAPESGFAAGLRLGLCLRLAWTGQAGAARRGGAWEESAATPKQAAP